MNNPKKTIDLLDQLKTLGFTDGHFDIVHHLKDESIESHKKYCENLTGVFKAGGTNEQVQRRLQIILNSYVSGEFTKQEVFSYLLIVSKVFARYN